MKVGDLVRLSAYGKKLKQNHMLAKLDPVGLIVRSKSFSIHVWVKWCGNDKRMDQQGHQPFFRNDLKYAK